MFRSQPDRRLLPSLAPSPSLGQFMSFSSNGDHVLAPCVPGPIRHSVSARARLQNPGFDSESMPSISHITQEDEISLALGMSVSSVLVYPRPLPVKRFDDLTESLRALTLWDSPDNGESTGTPMSAVQVYGNGSTCSLELLARDQMSDTKSAKDPDEMSLIEPSGSRASRASGLMSLCEERGQKSSRSATFLNLESSFHLYDTVPASAGFLSRSERKRLRTPSRNSTGSSRSGSPQELVRALESSGRRDPANIGPVQFKSHVPDMPELQYLVTYNLVNNFYYNLVSWSPLNNSIAIAIESKAYWWDGSSSVRDMNIQRPGLAPVSCVACSRGDALAVSFSDGYFCVYPIVKKRAPVSRQFASSVQCVEWFPDGTRLFTGDSHGAVCLLAYDGVSLQTLSQFPGFSQQICGIALNKKCTQVAVGANENLAIVWDISKQAEPQEKCRLRHTSAVKGMSFCPWAPSLLATGGGSNDRHLRFWHTGSGTLLKEVDTKRQITSVFWSSFYKEIMLTFGFSNDEDHVAAAIYKYPETHVSAQAVARDPLRALSATVAPDQTKVAIAANDGTVRVFGLWTERPYAISDSPTSIAIGSYGSPVVETAEGIGVQGPTVR